MFPDLQDSHVNAPRVLVIGREARRVGGLGHLAVQDLLEGVHPLAGVVGHVLLVTVSAEFFGG